MLRLCKHRFTVGEGILASIYSLNYFVRNSSRKVFGKNYSAKGTAESLEFQRLFTRTEGIADRTFPFEITNRR